MYSWILATLKCIHLEYAINFPPVLKQSPSIVPNIQSTLLNQIPSQYPIQSCTLSKAYRLVINTQFNQINILHKLTAIQLQQIFLLYTYSQFKSIHQNISFTRKKNNSGPSCSLVWAGSISYYVFLLASIRSLI